MTKRPKQKALYPDRDRLIFKVLREIRGLKASDVSKRAFNNAEKDPGRASVSPSTISKMRLGPKHGGTRYPRSTTLDAALGAVGKELGIVDKKK